MELKGADSLMKKLQAIAESMDAGHVDVGFMSEAKYPDGTGVAQVAFWNEFGTATSPPRPFFRGMIARDSGNWPEVMARQAKGTNLDGAKTLGLMGEYIGGQLIQSINDLETPKLADSTVAAKGFEKPLIDTSHMINSITYQINEGDVIPVKV